ncbi:MULTISPECIES: hypothetical protein [unclassified Bradyrhizobium]|uniref:hypothetical protein n=1 Tax=unclassified Bradyrhizobium TaxID=2631580 RepID=UPI001FF79815|nr:MULTISPECIES: hypothetical protein [unclassified Bradyrhizobium]MCK1299726.1 hypothetical protein [Bradyrhizobium sp. 37]MCK1771560.1 hypothetical protein [Bradyrhizobium sp. 134]
MSAEITHLNQAALPAPSDLERIELRVNGIRGLTARIYTENTLPALHRLAGDVDRALENAAEISAQLDAIQRPATKKELANYLSALRIAFPTAKAAGDGFSRVLIERVAAHTPSFGQLDWATRRLIDTSQFLPSVAEVLRALASARQSIEEARLFVDPRGLARLRRQVADRILEETPTPPPALAP